MQQKLMKRTVICSLLFSVIALGIIYYTTMHKVIVIVDIAQDEVSKSNSENIKTKELTFETGAAITNYLCIPLPEGTKSEAVSIENHYMDGEMWIAVKGSDKEFYDKCVISGNKEKITGGFYEQEHDIINLKFLLTGVYEYRSILEDNNLYIEFVSPREIYDKIVVIDPAFGGIQTGYITQDLKEKDISLSIAKKVKEKLDATDIKAYYTRMDDNNPEETARVMIANETKADMLIRIQANADKDSKIYGTVSVYNENFFIPGFGSIELADLLEREVVSNIKGKAIGLMAAQAEDYVIEQATVPAAAIKVGYLTNAQEAILLGKEDYLDRVATGIFNAIINAYK